MTRTKRPLGEIGLHRRRKLQQAQSVGHMWPALTHGQGDLVLRMAEAIDQRTIANGFF